MNKSTEKNKKLSLAFGLQVGAAALCLMAIPVVAWYANQNRIEALGKIKEPPSINLASGGADPALYITLENIDVTQGTEKFVVFSVEPGKYSAYDIQLAHTTNIPFTYELYRVKQDENGTIQYVDHTIDVDGGETELLYSIMTDAAGTTGGKLPLVDINPDNNSTGRILGDEEDLAAKNRKNYTDTDDVNQYVKPLYSVVRRIPQLNENEDDSSDRDYFAIRLSWTRGDNSLTDSDAHYWNYAYNNKETDLIYISAKQNTAVGNP